MLQGFCLLFPFKVLSKFPDSRNHRILRVVPEGRGLQGHQILLGHRRGSELRGSRGHPEGGSHPGGNARSSHGHAQQEDGHTRRLQIPLS